MILAFVRGTVVSTNKTERLKGSKLLVVQEWDVKTGKPGSLVKVAVDTVGAGIEELVLCVSGSSARQTCRTEGKPVDLAVVGIVDQVDLGEETCYCKYTKGGE